MEHSHYENCLRKFIFCGDFNAEHTARGSSIIRSEGSDFPMPLKVRNANYLLADKSMQTRLNCFLHYEMYRDQLYVHRRC